jgi:hypothetical protein
VTQNGGDLLIAILKEIRLQLGMLMEQAGIRLGIGRLVLMM